MSHKEARKDSRKHQKNTSFSLPSSASKSHQSISFPWCDVLQDPVRKEVPAAVQQCKNAGIMVRMVTGDNVFTAKHIAHECGIYTDGIAMEGPQFRRMAETNEAELIRDLPRLQVPSETDTESE